MKKGASKFKVIKAATMEEYWEEHTKQKDAWRRGEARKSFARKMQDLVKLQSWAMGVDLPWTKEWKGILPWGTYKPRKERGL